MARFRAQPDVAPRLLTRTEAAAYLGIAPHTLAVWACTRRYPLPFVKVGRCVRYAVSDLDRFILRHRDDMARSGT